MPTNSPAGPSPPIARPITASGATTNESHEEPTPAVHFDFSVYARIEALGDGEAKQKLRKFEDDFQVAQKEQGQATSTLEGTRRLFEKGFVTRIDLERDDIANENNRLKVQTAQTARDLFLKYEFIRTAEETLSKHAEAVRALTRARKAAISKMPGTSSRSSGSSSSCWREGSCRTS